MDLPFWFLFSLIGSLCLPPGCETLGETWNRSGMLNTNKTYIWPPSIGQDINLTLYQVEYNISFDSIYCHGCLKGARGPCCPSFLVDTWKDYMVKGPNASCADQLTLFSAPAMFNYYNIQLDPSWDYTGCKMMKGTNSTRCQKTLAFGAGHDVSVAFTFAACNSSKGINLKYNVTYTNITGYCIENPLPDLCLYSNTGLPGTLGFATSAEWKHLKFLFQNVLAAFKSCHQHAGDMFCRTVSPECKNESGLISLKFPCKRLCEEVVDSCRIELRDKGLTFSCNLFSDEGNCYYDPVTCKTPKKPNNGKVTFTSLLWNSTVFYACNNWFDSLDGFENNTCMANGEWDVPVPSCKANYGFMVGIVIAAIFACVLPTVIIVLLIKTFCNPEIPYEVTENEDEVFSYDAFITYCSEDASFVENTFRRRLEESRDPPYKLCMHKRDFVPGAEITDNIGTAIEQSAICIAMVSHAYTRSRWCKLEFSVAHNRILTGGYPSSSLLIVFLEEIPVNDLPVAIKNIYSTCTCLEQQDEQFWEKIVLAIKNAKQDRASMRSEDENQSVQNA